jgi:hypothetical protein
MLVRRRICWMKWPLTTHVYRRWQEGAAEQRALFYASRAADVARPSRGSRCQHCPYTDLGVVMASAEPRGSSGQCGDRQRPIGCQMLIGDCPQP